MDGMFMLVWMYIRMVICRLVCPSKAEIGVLRRSLSLSCVPSGRVELVHHTLSYFTFTSPILCTHGLPYEIQLHGSVVNNIT